jgi:hypothetical protein
LEYRLIVLVIWIARVWLRFWFWFHFIYHHFFFLVLRFFRFFRSAALILLPAFTAFLYALLPLRAIGLPLARFLRIFSHSPGFFLRIALLTFAIAAFTTFTVHHLPFVLFGLPASHVLHDQ